MMRETDPLPRRRPRGASRLARRLAGVLGLMLGLSACASHGDALLKPVAVDLPGTGRVDMLVATSRRPSAVPGQMFSGERDAALSFARITVSIPPDGARKVGEVQWPAGDVGDPSTDFVATRADRIDRAGALAWLGRRDPAVSPTGSRRHVLLFVHGYNNRFQDAVFRFAQIVHDSRAAVAPVLFTWPSRATVLAYGYDRESTAFSRDAFESVLRMLAADRGVEDISILSHSMGNWLTLETLRQMAIRDGRVAPKIRNVILAAPDVDVDLFRNDLASLGPHRPSMTLFVSQDDKALAVSRRVWGDAARLGAIDPTAEPLRSELAGAGIAVVDLTRIAPDDGLAHGKFADSPEVVRLLGERILAGQTITDAHVGLGDSIVQLTTDAATSAGSAAGLVLSAPVAAVDADARSRYGDQIRHLGSSLVDTAQSGKGVVGASIPAAR